MFSCLQTCLMSINYKVCQYCNEYEKQLLLESQRLQSNHNYFQMANSPFTGVQVYNWTGHLSALTNKRGEN